jgi:TonB family protein
VAFFDTQRLCAVGCALALACGASRAQQGELSDVERARRDADSPLRWIKLHADAPTRVAPAKPEPVRSEGARPAPEKASPAKPASNKAAVPAPARLARAAVPPAARDPDPAPAPPDAITPLQRTDPQWDPELMGALRRGQVEVRFTVAATGGLMAAKVLTSTNPQLDAAALAAMSQWRFAPMSTPQSASVEFGFDLDRGAIAASEPDLVAIDQAEPQWDAQLVQSLRKGSVRVHFEVGTNGRIANADVAAASDPRLADAALAAIRQWRFQPVARVRSGSLDFGFDLDH